MQRSFWIVTAGIVSVLALLTWQGYNATFLFHHPRTKGHRVVIDNRTGAAVVMSQAVVVDAPAESAKPKQPQPPSALPKAVASQPEFDFGVMDPLTVGEHTFLIHNRGDAPLKLTVGPTTCKCTLSGLERQEIPPGESASVTLQWNTGRNEHFAHAGTIYTNDPQRKSLELRVTGNVRVLFGLDEPEIALGTVDPDRPTVVERLIYSQYYSDFTVTKFESALKDLQWEVVDADPDQAAKLSAKSVRRLRVTIPGGRPQGMFGDTLHVTVQAGGENAEEQRFDLPLEGVVPRRLAFYGRDIDTHGKIELGDVREGQAARVQLLAKVRDLEPELPAAKVEVFPKFLQAKFEPVANKPGIYNLTIDLPDDAPAGQYHNDRTGRVRIESGHPRIGVVELPITFAVIPRAKL